MQVKDEGRSEIGRQRLKGEHGRNIHCCCICGKTEVWGATWTVYCSLKEIDEDRPIAKFCSVACRALGGPRASCVTDEQKQIARDKEFRDPTTVYREATDKEKYAEAVRNQPKRKP